MVPNEPIETLVFPSPIPRRNHQPLRVAILSLLPELSRRRRDYGRTGVVVTYETIREWSQKFGGTYAKRLRSRTPRPGDRWHLDEVYLSINGKLQYLWRAIRTAKCSISWCNRAATDRPSRSSFASCCDDCSMYRRPSSPTNSEVMPPPRRRYYLVCGTYKTSERTIAQRIPISRRANENVACEGSSRPGTRSGFSRPSGLSHRSFVAGAICS